MNQTDVELINKFFDKLEDVCHRKKVALRINNAKEEYAPNGVAYVSYFNIQVGMVRYQLYINLHANRKEDRYGWMLL